MCEDEKETVKKAQQGDEQAFSVLYERHYDKVFGVIYKYLKNEHDTEDVVQDTWVKAYINLNRFKGNSSLSTWLFRVASNNAKNFLLKKSNRVSKVSIVPEDLEEMFTDHNCPEEEMNVGEMKDMLEDATAELPNGQKEVYVLADHHRFTYRAISELLNIPIGTVRSRLSKARSHITQRKKEFDE